MKLYQYVLLFNSFINSLTISEFNDFSIKWQEYKTNQERFAWLEKEVFNTQQRK